MSGRPSLACFALACGAFLSACGKATPAGPASFTVLYTLVTSGPLVVDSLKYDNGSGALLKVTTPASGWTASLTVNAGGSVEGVAWVNASGPGSATLKVSWTVAGVSSQADSSFANPATPQHFTLSIAHRVL